MTNSKPIDSDPRLQFHLRDLVALITIVCALLAVAVVVIQRARENGRRIKCISNLKQLQLATANYESTLGCYPAGAPQFQASLPNGVPPLLGRDAESPNLHAGPNWALSILPYTDSKAYDQLLACRTADGFSPEFNACDDCSKAPWNIGTDLPSFFHCPSSKPLGNHSSKVTGLENLAKGNYAACFGSWKLSHSVESAFLPEPDRIDSTPISSETVGVMAVRHFRPRGVMPQDPYAFYEHEVNVHWVMGYREGTSVRKIRDGRSKTLLISEIVGTDAQADIRGVWSSNGLGAAAFTAYNPPNSGPRPSKKHPTYPNHTIEYGDRVIGCAASTAIPDPRLHCSAVADAGDQWATARSMHPGGVLAIHADGSTRFYSSDTDLTVWQKMASRDGGE